MRKILASDYDGTLSQNGISSRTIEMIKEFQSNGNLFGVVTGRTYTNSFLIFQRENLFPFDYIISHNGAVACDRNGQILFAHSVKGDIPWGSSTLAQELMLRCLELTQKPCGIALEKVRYEFHPDNYTGSKVHSSEVRPLSVLQDISYFNAANALCDDDASASKVVSLLKEEFGNVLNPIQNGRCIDITPAGIDKSTGIADYARLLDVSKDHIWTAGDNYNDIAMLEQYHGCAMTGGVEAAKQVAEHICDEVADVISLILKQ